MEMKSDLQKYTRLVNIRDALKPFTQASWTIKNLEKKADIDLIDPSDYDAVYDLYLRITEDVEEAYNKMKQILETKNKTNEETNRPIHKN